MVLSTESAEALAEKLDGLEDSEAVKVARRLIEDEEHNGWVNRETWAVVLHLQNDQMLNGAAMITARNAETKRGVAADGFQKFVTDNVHGVLHDRTVEPAAVWVNLASDVGSLWRVDWFAVADSFLEAVAEEDE